MEHIITDENNFQLRAYRKQELALMYFKDEEKSNATRNLRRWIEQCTELLRRLTELDYNKRRKFYTRQEVELIIQYLGMP